MTRVSSNQKIFFFLSEKEDIEVITEKGSIKSNQTFKNRFEEMESLGEVS